MNEITHAQRDDWEKNSNPKLYANVAKLSRPIVAIVALKTRFEMPRDHLLQVTLDPAELSPRKTHIRLGNTHGDEFLGWVPTEEIEVREVVALFGADEIVPKMNAPQAAPTTRILAEQQAKATA